MKMVDLEQIIDDIVIYLQKNREFVTQENIDIIRLGIQNAYNFEFIFSQILKINIIDIENLLHFLEVACEIETELIGKMGENIILGLIKLRHRPILLRVLASLI